MSCFYGEQCGEHALYYRYIRTQRVLRFFHISLINCGITVERVCLSLSRAHLPIGVKFLSEFLILLFKSIFSLSILTSHFRVCSFEMIQIRISDPRSLGSWYIT